MTAIANSAVRQWNAGSSPVEESSNAELGFLAALRAAACTLEEAANKATWRQLERQCLDALGMDEKTLAFLLERPVIYKRARARLHSVRDQWAPSLSKWRLCFSRRPCVAILLTEGQAIRTFLATDVCKRVAKWAELFILSPHEISKEVAALGPHAHLLYIPPFRRSHFDNLVGFAGFRHTGSPTIQQFSRRLDENLQKAKQSSSDVTGNIRIWQIANAFPSYEAYCRLYSWNLRFFATAYALDHVAALLREINPDVLINTSDVSWSARPWTRAAALNGTPIISAVISWDNISTKTLLTEFADTFLVWSDEMDEDFASSLPFLRQKRRVVVGSPQFEPIRDGRGLVPRAEFFSRYGLAVDKKLILYTTGSKTLFPAEPECLEAVLFHWRSCLRDRANIMVRMHPKDRQGRYAALISKFPEVPFTLAGQNLAEDDDWVPTQEDVALLVNQLRHCDLVVNVASTMTLEGFAVDKPSVNIGFTLGSSVSARYPMEDYYKSRHYRDIVDSGAAPLVKSYEELFAAIEGVLDHGAFNLEEQRRVLRQKCSFVDGASSRIEEFVRQASGQRSVGLVQSLRLLARAGRYNVILRAAQLKQTALGDKLRRVRQKLDRSKRAERLENVD